MGKIKDFFIKIGFLKESKFVNDLCLNCGKPLKGRQTRFCSPYCGAYYHGVKTPIKFRRQECQKK